MTAAGTKFSHFVEKAAQGGDKLASKFQKKSVTPEGIELDANDLKVMYMDSKEKLPETAVQKKWNEFYKKKEAAEKAAREADQSTPPKQDTEGTPKASIKSVDEILEGANPGRATKGKATQYEKTGGFDQALDDFNSMGVTDVKDIPGGKVGKLPDGRTVNVRNKSSDGRPTLEIYDGKKSINIRY